MTDGETRAPVLTFRVAYHFGDIVYLIAGDGQDRGMVTDYKIDPDGVCYGISWGNRTQTYHYEIELTADRPSFEP